MVTDLSKFKNIPGFSRYKISEYGDVYSIPRKKILSTSKNWAGYLTVTLVDDSGFRSPRKIHRLVYLTYIGPLEDGKVVDHKDDNKLHNHHTNLQQITPSENSIKSFVSGKNADKVVWPKETIHLICELMEQNMPTWEIFTSIGYDYYSHKIECNILVGQLRRGEIHKDVSKNYNIKNYICSVNKVDARLDIASVRNIYMMMLFGDSPAELSRIYGVTHSSICKIRDKKTWKNVTNQIDKWLFED